MKKGLIVIAILISIVDFTIGQNKFSVSFNFMPQYIHTTENSKLQLDRIFNINYSSDLELGYKFQKLQFKTGIIYSKQKQKFDVKFNFDTDVPNRELMIDLSYLKIPFYINYDLIARNKMTFCFHSGLEINILQKSNDTFNNTYFEMILLPKTEYKKILINPVLGLSYNYKITDNLVFTNRYIFSFGTSNIFDNDNHAVPNENEWIGYDLAKQSIIGISIGFEYFFGKSKISNK